MISYRLAGAAALFFVVSMVANAAHHVAEQEIAAAASAGQIIVVYDWPCRDTKAGIAALKELIAYEADATPISYSSVPVVHNSYSLGAVDVHDSPASFEKASAWQADDARWQELLQAMADVCNSPMEELNFKVLPVR